MESSPAAERGVVGIYLNDHLAGSTAGLELFRRAARANAGTQIGAELANLVPDIEEDRAALIEMMGVLGVPRRQYKIVIGWVGEKVGRFKLNGRLISRSPLSPLIEVEALRLGVEGKAHGWRVLKIMAAADRRLDINRLNDLDARAQRQIAVLESLHQRAAELVVTASADD